MYLERLRDEVKPRTLEVWCTNLEYDLVNTFGPERIAECLLRFSKVALVAARWRGIEFRDTVRHLPASVKELGTLVGLPKLERDTSVAYCVRDTTITFRAAKLVHQTYVEFDEYPRATLPSTTYSIWQRQFWRDQVYAPDRDVREAGRLAYYGGRTEPFAIGAYDAPRAVDAASMFPWAMIAGEFPVPWGPVKRVRGDRALQALGVYHAECELADGLRPSLPVRTPEGTIFPVGKWRGWYVGEELIYFKSIGGRVRVLEGIEFFYRVRPFETFVAEMFERKSAARNPALRNMYKLILNSLYGKFGQTGERLNAMELSKFEQMEKRPAEFRVWCGIVFYRTEGEPPPWTNYVWPAIVTARARIRLHREIVRIEKAGGIPLYCDTDSVIYTGAADLHYPEKARRPGDFEFRGKFRSVLIVGKKEYGLEHEKNKWTVHAKGVPLSERRRYLLDGVANFERPVKMREAARSGETANNWTKRTKQRRVSFSHRARRPDGTLAPVKLTGRENLRTGEE